VLHAPPITFFLLSKGCSFVLKIKNIVDEGEDNVEWKQNVSVKTEYLKLYIIQSKRKT